MRSFAREKKRRVTRGSRCPAADIHHETRPIDCMPTRRRIVLASSICTPEDVVRAEKWRVKTRNGRAGRNVSSSASLGIF